VKERGCLVRASLQDFTDQLADEASALLSPKGSDQSFYSRLHLTEHFPMLRSLSYDGRYESTVRTGGAATVF
jgi:hypothetical protein